MNTQPRKVKGVPEGRYWGLIREWQGQLLLVYPMGQRDVVKLSSRSIPPGASKFVFPFPIIRIDPDMERVVEEFESGRWSAIAFTAERERRPDSWLALNYEDWVIDAQKNLAYALKSDRWMDISSRHVCVIDLKQKEVIVTLREWISRIHALALSPDGEKLYVAAETAGRGRSSGDENVPIPGVVVISTKNLTVNKRLSLGPTSDTPNGVEAMVFTKDGKRLFCGTRGGLLVIDVKRDEFEAGGEGPANVPCDFGVKDRGFSSYIALAPDEKEVYLGSSESHERNGAVVAIDIAQKKLVRRLELSPTACTSVAVAKGKLFAACLDGVYVIDIDRWRAGR